MRYTIFTLLKPFFFFWIMSDPNGKEYVLQIQCIDAATMEREYTVLTSPTAAQILGYGPLGLGPRWIAYSGIPVPVPGTGRVSPQLLSLSPFVPPPGSNGSVVAYFAKESSKQLAAGIVTLGDVGYKKISKYCADFIPNGNGIVKQRSSGYKVNGATNGHLIDSEYAGTGDTSYTVDICHG